MPGAVRGAVAFDTLPYSLSTKFTQLNSMPMNINRYRDNSSHRKALATETRRTWKISKRLNAADLKLLREFCFNAKGRAFYFYNPQETLPPFSNNPIGTAGRYIVRFNSNWSETTNMGRTDCEIELIEVTTATEDIPVVTGSEGLGGGGDTGGGPTDPQVFALFVSDLVEAGTITSGLSGAFSFTQDQAPKPSWVSLVSVDVDNWGGVSGPAHLTIALTSSLGELLPLGSFYSSADVGASPLGPSSVLVNRSSPKTLYPPIYSDQGPTFNYSVTSVDTSNAAIYGGFSLSVVEVPASSPVRIGWPHYHPESGWLHSLYDDLDAYANRISAGYTPDQAVVGLSPFDIVATQALSFSSITLRLIGMDSYFPTTDIPTPSEIGLGGRTATFSVSVGTSVYSVSLGVPPAAITLPSAVSVAIGETVLSIGITSASANWMDSDYETAPFPLISVLLS